MGRSKFQCELGKGVKAMRLIIPTFKRICTGFAVIVLLLLVGTGSASGALFEVAAGDVDGLVAAIESANDEIAYPGEDTIALAASGVFAMNAVYDADQNGLPVINSILRIDGNNATLVREGTASLFRFFTVEVGGVLIVNNLVLKGGDADDGGAVYNSGYFEMNGGALEGNHAADGGGALYNNNSWTQLTGVAVRDNSSEGSGGAIVNWLKGTVVLQDSTFSTNRAHYGGGGAIADVHYARTTVDSCAFVGNRSLYEGGAVFHYNGGSLEVVNSTFSGNRSEYYGGAIYGGRNARVTIAGSTLAENNADIDGATIFVWDNASVEFAGSLVVSSGEVVSHCAGDFGGAVISDSSSLATDSTCGDAMAVPYAYLKLGPLALNNGMTMTHKLYEGSWAIDHVDGVVGMPEVDQRGVVRPNDGDGDAVFKADAGAFELGTKIDIDIEPEDDTNTLKLNSRKVDVLVLRGSGGFDVSTLTEQDMVGVEVLFGNELEVESVTKIKNMDKKKVFDHHLSDAGLMLHFSIEETGLDVSDKMACLEIYLVDGRALWGCGSVNIVP